MPEFPGAEAPGLRTVFDLLALQDCGRLAAADAARFLAVLERAIQHDWRRITRTVDRRLALQFADGLDAVLIFGRPDQDIGTAIRTLNQQLSPES